MQISFNYDHSKTAAENVTNCIEFHKLLTDAGITSPSQQEHIAKAPKEVGEHEQSYLNRYGKKWMRVPGDWQGTREEFAKLKLNDVAPLAQESSASEDENPFL